ncbi:MAG: hypothetical protein FJ279_04715 [Planctomycetes bacterium]|nr:hypothetical protein [Planctomycetota bacterium]
MLVMSVFLLVPFSLPVYLLPFALIGTLVQRTRRVSFLLLLFCTLTAVSGIGLATVAYRARPGVMRARMTAFHELAGRSAPLVQAIHKFDEENGRPPVSLDDLVPRYLPSIPGTGMGAYPRYEYVAGDKAKQRYGNPWALYIHTSIGFCNFDMFLYFPNQNYPEKGYGGVLERVRDWAYVHE